MFHSVPRITAIIAAIILSTAFFSQLPAQSMPIATQTHTLLVEPQAGVAIGDAISFIQPIGAPMMYSTTQQEPYGLAQGDFNADGKLDLAVTENLNHTKNLIPVGLSAVAILLGNGDGSFQAPVRMPIESGFARGILSKDFDRDGLLDLLVDVREQSRVLFYRGRGDGTFLTAVSSPTTNPADNVQSADLNVDGLLDLALAANSTGNVVVLMGKGDGSFQPATLHKTPNAPTDVAIADLNSDNAPDIVVGCIGCYKIGVLLNTGTGLFPTNATEYQTNISGNAVDPVAVQIADYNSDGKRDVLAIGSNGGLALLIGQGNGLLIAPPAPANVIEATAGWRGWGENSPPDLNNDGKADVLYNFVREGVGGDGTGLLHIGLGRGDGHFDFAKVVASPGSGVPWNKLDGGFLNSSTWGDFNGDGLLDLVVGTEDANGQRPGGIATLLATNPGVYRSPRSYYAASQWDGDDSATVLGDFTSDGKLDLIALNTFILGDKELLVMPGNGDGSFSPGFQTGIANSQYWRILRSADFDKDGKLDLLYLNIGLDRSVIAFGLGTGTFTDTKSYTSATTIALGEPINSAISDFNGDSYPDYALIVGWGGDAELEVYTYNPDPPRTFIRQPTRLSISPAGAKTDEGMVAADFDKDGRADIIVRGGKDGAGERFLFFKGNGDATFQAPTIVGSGQAEVREIEAVDLNNDGKLDLAAVADAITTANNEGGAWVQLGIGDGTFLPPLILPAVAGGRGIEVADFNLDGKLDLAVTTGGIGRFNYGMAVWQGNGDGSFAPYQRFAVGDNAVYTLNAVDLTGDGNPEIVAGHRRDAQNNAFTVLVNDSGARADLILSMTQQPVQPVEGEVLTYTITISNTGPHSASNVVLRNPIHPSMIVIRAQPGLGSCTIDLLTKLVLCPLGVLPVGGVTAIQLTVIPRQLIQLWNTASVSSDTPDPNWVNNAASIGQSESNEIVVKSPYFAVVGATYDYAVRFVNRSSQIMSNTVILLNLPGTIEYINSSHGGLYDPERHEVFWRLGNIPINDGDTLAVKVRVAWGVPNHTPYQLVAMIGSTNRADSPFDVQRYLTFNPVVLSAITRLSTSEVDALLTGNVQAKTLFDHALAQGFAYHNLAYRLQNSDGSSLVQISMIDLTGGELALVTLSITPDSVFLDRVSKEGLDVFDTSHGWRYEARSGRISEFQPTVSSAATNATWSDCMRNCILRAIPELVIKQRFKVIDKVAKLAAAANCIASGDANSNACTELGEEALSELGNRLGTEPSGDIGVKLGKCKDDCDKNPDTHVCTEDVTSCEKSGAFGSILYGPTTCVIRRCDKTTGVFLYGNEYISCQIKRPCGFGEISVCSDGQCSCIDPDRPKPPPPTTHIRPGDTVTARDPNRKLGPSDVVAGERITYTVEYENVGDGSAFAVYIIDDLDPQLDASTISVGQSGVYIASLRRIVWQIGDLPAKGKGAVHFSINVTTTVNAGETFANVATIVFPSVPQFTETNAVVSTVRTVAARGQVVETTEQTPVEIRVSGSSPTQLPLSFQITHQPQFGTLNGLLPVLTYTPDPGFEGIDEFSFTATDTTNVSLPALVTIRVNPSAVDKVAPAVVATSPQPNAVVEVDTTQYGSSGYFPILWAQFSEPIDPATVIPANVQVLLESKPIGGTVHFDVSRNEIQFIPKMPLLKDTVYQVILTTAIHDTSGNALTSPYSWQFRAVAAGGSLVRNVFLPLVSK